MSIDNENINNVGIEVRIEQLEGIINEMLYRQKLIKKIYITDYTQRLLEEKVVGDETYDQAIARIVGDEKRVQATDLGRRIGQTAAKYLNDTRIRRG